MATTIALQDELWRGLDCRAYDANNGAACHPYGACPGEGIVIIKTRQGWLRPTGEAT
jgi:hypothetical protein